MISSSLSLNTKSHIFLACAYELILRTLSSWQQKPFNKSAQKKYMAESSTPANFKLLATKTVQEQLIEGELPVPPQKYILKDGIPLPDASVELMDVPVIDLGLLRPSSINMQEFDKIRSALTKWGCFQVRIQTQLVQLLKVRTIDLLLPNSVMVDLLCIIFSKLLIVFPGYKPWNDS